MFYSIAGHKVEIDYDQSLLQRLLPSFTPFQVADDGSKPLMRLVVMSELAPAAEGKYRLIRDVDTGNGKTRVDRLHDGGYQFLVRDVYDRPCALLVTSPYFSCCQVSLQGGLATRRFALNNALMLAYAFSAAHHDTLLIHASVVRHKGRAYAFTAKSGTGKSTHVANWMRYIEDCDIINDDNPVIRLIDGNPVLYGSPWSGKTPCYRNVSAPLGAIMLIERDTTNHVRPLSPIMAFSTVLTSCSAMKWDEELYQQVCRTCSRFVETTTVAAIHCLPDREAVEVCKNAIA
ncbi:MAG: hypothetical protein IJ782_02965 [Prevotella sp.]|nr:hypothetical protein [Prevotella sp.]